MSRPRFISLTEKQGANEHPLLVNLDDVTAVRPEAGGGVQIHVAGVGWVTVKEGISLLSAKLKLIRA